MLRALDRFLPEGMSAALAGFGGMLLVRILGGLLLLKLAAVHLGPQGLGGLAQLMSLVAIISSFSGGGITNALIQNLAGAASIAQRQRCLSAGVKIYLCEAAIAAALLVLFAPLLAESFLHDASLAWLFWLLAGVQVLVGAGNVLQAVYSVMQRTGLIVAANCLGTVVGVALFAWLVVQHQQTGAAIGLVLFPATGALVGIIIALFVLPGDWRKLTRATDAQAMRSLLSYVPTMLVMVAAVPLTQIALRQMPGASWGWDYVGYWQAVLKISDAYMQFIGMVLIYYALPRFSAQRSRAALDAQFCAVRLPLMAAMLLGLVTLFLLRDVVLQLLFTPEFLPARAYFLPQCVTDFCRALAMMYVYYALSRGARMMPVWYELVQAALTFALFVPLQGHFEMLAPAYAQMGAAMLTLLVMACLHRGITLRRFTEAA